MVGENHQIDNDKNFFPDLEIPRLRDKRVDDWPSMKSPHPYIAFLIFYLLAVYVILPWYMKNRKPYELKTFIKCYNVFQVISCSIIAYKTLTSAWTGWNSFGCKRIEHSKDEKSMQLLSMFWWNMVIKIIEATETIVFSLRKKSNQITGLHVYHHTSSGVVAWISTKYAGGGMLYFSIVLNSCVHVLMYSYYFLASLGPEMQKKLSFIKSKLTIIQLVQLVILFIHTLQALSPNCDVHIAFPIIYLPLLAMNIILFLKFYQKTYANKKSN